MRIIQNLCFPSLFSSPSLKLTYYRISTQGHQAQEVFHKDVKETYEKLRNRARELAQERAANPESAGVETIQLQAVEPGTSINIAVPPSNSDDPVIQNSRKIFETFPPGLQRALESGNLDEVNKVLAKMSVEEAEEIVEMLGEVCAFKATFLYFHCKIYIVGVLFVLTCLR